MNKLYAVFTLFLFLFSFQAYAELRLLLIGAPCSGKGTQGALLSKHFHLKQFAFGDYLRDQQAKKTELGLAFSDLMNRGEIPPDGSDIMLSLFHNVGGVLKSFYKEGFIMDGIRSRWQAEQLQKILAVEGKKLDATIYLDASPEMLLARSAGRLTCSCGASYHVESKPPKIKGFCDECHAPLKIRPDDASVSVFKKRLEIFDQTRAEVLDFYEKAGILISITHQEVDPETTFQMVLENLHALNL